MDSTTLDDVVLIAIIGRAGAPESMDGHAAGRIPFAGKDAYQENAKPTLSQAIGVLYDRYGRLVYTIAYRMVGDRETAEEITQDVFVRIWENAHTYRPEMARVNSWLVSITRHRAIDELRKRGARIEKSRVDWPEDDGIGRMDGFFRANEPVEMVEANLEAHSVRESVTALPADQREVLSLAYFKGLTHREIADYLSEPLGTVKSRIRLAVQKLRDSFIEQGIMVSTEIKINRGGRGEE